MGYCQILYPRFFKNYQLLNLTKPRLFTKATDHIKEQISLIQKIEANGFAYKISDGIYFDVTKWEKTSHQYGVLSSLDQIKAGARVEVNPEKKDPRDFALWKFSPTRTTRQMEWDSPWGKGFPGWHVECSAMSIKYLGSQFDIHVGGEDLKSTHHPNEIAQSEAATGKNPFVKYWVHGAFLQIDGGRMGKSLGNAYTVTDIIKKDFDPLALRYFYLTGHYHRPLNFTWEALEAAQISLNKLRNQIFNFQSANRRTIFKENESIKLSSAGLALQYKFSTAISDDLNLPEALAVIWKTLKSNINNQEKYQLLIEWDRVLGLDLDKVIKAPEASKEIKLLIEKREALRKEQKWQEADELRKKIEAQGYSIEDTAKGTVAKKRVAG